MRRGLGPGVLALLAAASSITPGCGCGSEREVDEAVYITEAQFEQLSAATGSWDCMDLCALQNTEFDGLTSCEVSSAESAVGIDDTAEGDTGATMPGFIWLVTCTGTQRMLCR